MDEKNGLLTNVQHFHKTSIYHIKGDLLMCKAHAKVKANVQS